MWLLLFGPLDRVSGGDPARWLMTRYGTARRLAACYLLLVGAAVAVAFGF